MDNNDKNVVDYLRALTETNGVSVATVEDGWVFSFTKDKIQELIEGVGDSEKIIIFVKSQEKAFEQGQAN